MMLDAEPPIPKGLTAEQMRRREGATNDNGLIHPESARDRPDPYAGQDVVRALSVAGR